LTHSHDHSQSKQQDRRTDQHRIGSSHHQNETQFNWRIHHPFEGVDNRVAVEVSPWRGLLPRWRFVLPGEYKGSHRWGVGAAGTGKINENVKRPAKDGPIQMVNGPLVIWFGGHESLSPEQSAYLVFEGEAPHYIAFGQADTVGGPPGNLEGISFGNDHPTHPNAHLDPGHHHDQPSDHPANPHIGHEYINEGHNH
tara:strand:+ start:639 stop:1226 length:588 start_codon:yes stop_codon:yes gene_type:complete